MQEWDFRALVPWGFCFWHLRRRSRGMCSCSAPPLRSVLVRKVRNLLDVDSLRFQLVIILPERSWFRYNYDFTVLCSRIYMSGATNARFKQCWRQAWLWRSGCMSEWQFGVQGSIVRARRAIDGNTALQPGQKRQYRSVRCDWRSNFCACKKHGVQRCRRISL